LPDTSSSATPTALLPVTVVLPSMVTAPVIGAPTRMPAEALPSTTIVPVWTRLPVSGPSMRIAVRPVPSANGPSRSPSLSVSVGV